MRTALPLAVVVTASCLAGASARADEGMWPYHLAPVEQIAQRHRVTLTDAWLERVMHASVRFNNGGSGAFVSANGLVMTNHHVGAGCIQKLSSQEGAPDHLSEGFLANTRAEEQACPGLELNRLESITDVTAQIEAAAAKKRTDAEKNTARKAKMAALEKACTQAAGADASRRCDVVTLYSGGSYALYRYTKFTDVRLVFAPELAVAFFGGDADNFTFPRRCLDVAFFRVYREGQPVLPKHFLPLSQEGPKLGEAVFVSGHPGSTDRFSTASELRLLRDTVYPTLLDGLRAKRAMLQRYMKSGEAQRRAASKDLFGVENAIKAITGYLAGLNDAALMAEVDRRVDDVKRKLGALPPAERERLLAAWPKLDAAYAEYGQLYRALAVTERSLAPSGQLVRAAKTLVRLAAELPKPSAARLREYRDSNLASLEHRLFSEAPVEPSYEVERVAFGLEQMRAALGQRDPTVRAALAGRTPHERAREVVKASQLADVGARRALLAKIREAIERAGPSVQQRAAAAEAVLEQSGDGLIAFVRAYEPRARALRRRYEDRVQSVERTYKGRISQAWAKAYGEAVYPDANFTLRLNAGVVKRVKKGERWLPWRTQFGDLFVAHKRARGLSPYALPERWLRARARLNFQLPLNFISTNDIIGGNSGSPVVNQAGQAVGLIFDGNLAMLPNRFLYREERARAISVSSAAILHALDVVYRASALQAELRAQ